jgi:hypothetical protein
MGGHAQLRQLDWTAGQLEDADGLKERSLATDRDEAED